MTFQWQQCFDSNSIILFQFIVILVENWQQIEHFIDISLIYHMIIISVRKHVNRYNVLKAVAEHDKFNGNISKIYALSVEWTTGR